jgi:AcrR family transcriptional regulator
MAKKDGYHHGDLRAGLVEAARALVEVNGPERLSLSDACRAAGVSTAAPYRHFPDKDALLFAVAQEGMERQAHDAGGAANTPWGARRRRRHRSRLRGLRDARARRVPADVQPHARPREEAALVAKGEATFGIVLAQIAARTGHEASTDPQVLLTGFKLWTFVHGLSFLLIDDKLCKLDLDRLVDVDA